MSDTTPPVIDHDLVNRLFTLHPPKSISVEANMDMFREKFIDLGHEIVTHIPRTPDRTIAIRSLHRACMDVIAAIACNQDSDDD